MGVFAQRWQPLLTRDLARTCLNAFRLTNRPFGQSLSKPRGIARPVDKLRANGEVIKRYSNLTTFNERHTLMTTLTPYDISGGIATITLRRPEKFNAINYAMIDALMAALDSLEANAAVGAVIVTGAGEQAFSAGGDIYEFSESVRTRGINTSIGEGLHIESEQFAHLVPTRDLSARLTAWKQRRTTSVAAL